ncbi:MAG: PilZ domain-containing protein [Acidobacteriota bacterium]|nr:PilZ domain-containing protein [Acidobacteriota bacterium]
MRNRRNFERFGTDMIFWMKPVDSDEDFHPFAIENISAGGILIDTDKLYDAGVKVMVEFELPQYSDLIHARAVVRHCKPENEGGFKLGLEFETVQELSGEQLLEFLEDLFK